MQYSYQIRAQLKQDSVGVHPVSRKEPNAIGFVLNSFTPASPPLRKAFPLAPPTEEALLLPRMPTSTSFIGRDVVLERAARFPHSAYRYSSFRNSCAVAEKYGPSFTTQTLIELAADVMVWSVVTGLAPCPRLFVFNADYRPQVFPPMHGLPKHRKRRNTLSPRQPLATPRISKPPSVTYHPTKGEGLWRLQAHKFPFSHRL
ncbi:hypothetical protein ACRALDRAFT_208204 [Sodiomyces alcalophilus JCM 7366]|uniref:uncharacterized protein n=1 Tax=Sodiomyces alcalophilus JCM 7366 TaxID=591952 RepID=UPI0039B51A40